MLFDYEILRIIWWVILVLLVMGFTITDGFDIGIGMLLPFLGKSDDERRVILNTIGPTWEGNQTWLITLGGVSFGAWALVYSAVFSGLYIALIILLFGLFLRPVGFDYRSKLANPYWRSFWDWALFLGSLIPALVLSVAVGNLIIGLPFHFDQDFRVYYTGNFLGLFTPFPLFCVVIGGALLVMHGAVYLHWKTEGVIAERTRKIIPYASLVFVLSFILAGCWLAFGIDGYEILSAIDKQAVNSVLVKQVSVYQGAWLSNYRHNHWLYLAPFITIDSVIILQWCLRKQWSARAFIASAMAIIGALATAAGSMFPFIVPSKTVPNNSLTVWDASASAHSLELLLLVTTLLLPVVLAYTSWVYRVMKGKVTVEHIQQNTHTVY